MAAVETWKPTRREVSIPIAGIRFPARLFLPDEARGIVIVAQGSGQPREGIRKQYIADQLVAHGIGVLLVSLLTPEEARDRAKVVNIELLAARFLEATAWIDGQPELHEMSVGYLGDDLLAAGALIASNRSPRSIAAMVSISGRPDLAGLAGATLENVTTPMLLLVGGEDTEVLRLNRLTQARLKATKQLVIVPGARHLFAEPGTLETAAIEAAAWFAEFSMAESRQVSGLG